MSPASRETTSVDAGSEALTLRRCLDEVLPKSRGDFPGLLNCLGLLREAVEVGVQSGVHASAFLSRWKGQRLRLVDTWGASPNERVADAESVEGKLFYVDIANTDGANTRQRHRARCEERLEAELRSGRAEIVHEDSVAAAARIPDRELDFVYLDARHDFEGVVADVHAWWPKVRIGGIFAGHDFVDGEFPEGDFFWISALRAVLPSLESEARVTEERHRYPSFFIVKTRELASTAPLRVPDVAGVARRLYAQQSRYFALWRGAGAGADAPAFSTACAELCEHDCNERVRDFTPTHSPGSTLRPFACGGASASGTATASAGAAAGGGGALPVALGGAAGADVCAADLVVDVAAYRGVCLERCGVTCAQRAVLFSAVGEQILSAGSTFA